MSAGTFFDAEAARYDASYEADDWGGRFLRARLEAALDAIGDGPGDVLDAGMGGGRLVAELAGRGWTVSGVDASARMVDLARQRQPQLAGRLLLADLAALPFPDGSFDAVVVTGAIEYVDDLDRGLAEVVRVLRPGGRTVVSFPNYRSPHALWRRFALYPAARLAKRVLPLDRPAPMRPLHPVTLGRFSRRLTSAGLDVVARRAVGPQAVFEAVKR
jgi:SAM-dependent methyltransferase